MKNVLTWSDSLDNLDKVLDSGNLHTKKIITYEEYSHDAHFKNRADILKFRECLNQLKRGKDK